MLILVEGVDGSGKTTLCKQLVDKCKVQQININGALSEAFDLYRSFVSHVTICNTTVITDRSFVTDLVYRLSDDKPRETIDLSQMCYLLRGPVAIVLCETDTSYEDAMKRGEDNIIDKQRSDEIKKTYEIITSMFNKFLNVPVYKYNWKKQNVGDVINFIKEVNNAVR